MLLAVMGPCEPRVLAEDVAIDVGVALLAVELLVEILAEAVRRSGIDPLRAGGFSMRLLMQPRAGSNVTLNHRFSMVADWASPASAVTRGGALAVT